MKRPNPFLHPLDNYQRDLNYMEHYCRQTALFLSKMRNIPLAEAREFVNQSVAPGGVAEFKDVPIVHTYRKPNGDRFKKSSTLLTYLSEAVREEDVIAPTLTRYVASKKYETPLVKSIDYNVASRNVAKGEMFKARQAGLTVQAAFKNTEQTGFKLSNNAVSGGHVMPGTVIFNKTAHSSLTSTCRITAAFANVNNERLLSGARMYLDLDKIIGNFCSILDNTNFEEFDALMLKYRLHYPSVEEVMKMVDRSAAHNGVRSDSAIVVQEFLSQLTPVELAAILYTGDLYHVRLYNDEFMRGFFDRLTLRITDVKHPDPKASIKASDGDYVALAWLLQGSITQEHAKNKKGLWDLEEEQIYSDTASTLDNIYETLHHYDDFIKTIIVSFNLPNSQANFDTAMRRAVLTGDTDSTIFTVQDWVKWYTGAYRLDEKGMKIYTAAVFVVSQSVVHSLAQMSANIGVDRSRLLDITMKSEYLFPVFAPTTRSKHYIAGIYSQEGNVGAELSYEIKGVHLRSSAVPIPIMNRARKLMERFIDLVYKGEKISVLEELGKLQQLEEHILKKIKAGNHDFFQFNQVKTADSYKTPPERSPFHQYTLWRDVFAPKYGEVPEPPYSALKINTTLGSDREFELWLDSLEDKALAARFRTWCEKNDKKAVRTFLLPEQVIESSGIPDEIFGVMDKRRAILDNTKVFYMVLELLNVLVIDDKINNLAIDLPKIGIPYDETLNEL